jgi:uncharacterized protein (TIGR02246 family)
MKLPRTGLAILGLLTLGPGLISCAQKQATDSGKSAEATQAQDQNTIRALDADWVRAVAAKDAEKSASFYADSGILLAPGARMATGRDAVQKTWAGLMAAPGFALSFTPDAIHVSQSGDLAYEVGTYELTTATKPGKPETVKASYVVVWGKQADGTWKALVDAPTTTQ